MKTSVFQLMIFVALATTANAQLQLGANVSSLSGHGRNDNHTTLGGATIFGQYFLTDNIAIGAVVHTYKPKKTKYSNNEISYTATDDVTNISTSYAVFFLPKTSLVQPYAGVDMGVSLSNHNIGFANGKSKEKIYKIQQIYFMVSPKAGLDIDLASSFGAFTQVQYNFSRGDGNPALLNLQNGKNKYVLKTEPISKYFNVDAGIYMKLGNLKKVLN